MATKAFWYQLNPHSDIETPHRYSPKAGRQLPVTLDSLHRDIWREHEGLLFELPEGWNDLAESADQLIAFDALTSQFKDLERKVRLLVARRMNQAGKELSVQSDANGNAELILPEKAFKRNGVTQTYVGIPLSDGQVVYIYFHNPDTTPNKISPSDTMVAWKWLLNKADITITVAPESGKYVDITRIAKRIMQLAESNSSKFLARQDKIKKQKEDLEKLEIEVAQKEERLKGLYAEIEEAKKAALKEYEDERKIWSALSGHITNNNGKAALIAEERAEDMGERYSDFVKSADISRFTDYLRKYQSGHINDELIKVIEEAARKNYESRYKQEGNEGKLAQRMQIDFSMSKDSIDRSKMHKLLSDWFKRITGEEATLDALSPMEFEDLKDSVKANLEHLPNIDDDDLWLTAAGEITKNLEKLEVGVGVDIIPIAAVRKMITDLSGMEILGESDAHNVEKAIEKLEYVDPKRRISKKDQAAKDEAIAAAKEKLLLWKAEMQKIIDEPRINPEIPKSEYDLGNGTDVAIYGIGRSKKNIIKIRSLGGGLYEYQSDQAGTRTGLNIQPQAIKSLALHLYNAFYALSDTVANTSLSDEEMIQRLYGDLNLLSGKDFLKIAMKDELTEEQDTAFTEDISLSKLGEDFTSESSELEEQPESEQTKHIQDVIDDDQPHTKVLESIIEGEMDTRTIEEVYKALEGAANALDEMGLSDEHNDLIDKAASYWATLESKTMEAK